MNARSMSGINDSTSSGGGGTGDALLAGGTTASPQIFTGVNEFSGATNSNIGLLEQTAITSNTFIQEKGADGNFIEQSGTNKGHIIQQADTSVIRQNGADAEIKQSGNDAEILQTGTTTLIKQEGTSSSIKQTGTTSLIEQTGASGCLIKTTGYVRSPLLPLLGNDLCNKTYVDAVSAKTGFGQNFANNPIIAYVVSKGNPTETFSGGAGDDFGGRMDTPVSGLNADIYVPALSGAIGEVGKVKVDYSVTGEWNSVEWDKGLILARAEQAADGTFPYTVLFRAQTDPSYPATGRCLSIFNMSYQSDRSSTMEDARGFIVDDTALVGKTYRYTPVLLNFSDTVGTFYLNRVISNVNVIFYERAVSCITATLINV
jgi:hypothetical protein